MYGDNPKITVIPVRDDNEAFKFIMNNRVKYSEVRVIGFNGLNPQSGMSFEKQFYHLAGVNFNKKWDNFHINRNLEKERNIKNNIIQTIDPYVFVHDDIQREMKIDESLLKDKLVIRPASSYSNNIFDFCTLIQAASEVHVIDSCFMFLIDQLQYDAPGQKLFVHRYSRYNDDWLLPELRKNWKIILKSNNTVE